MPPELLWPNPALRDAAVRFRTPSEASLYPAFRGSLEALQGPSLGGLRLPTDVDRVRPRSAQRTAAMWLIYGPFDGKTVGEVNFTSKGQR